MGSEYEQPGGYILELPEEPSPSVDQGGGSRGGAPWGLDSEEVKFIGYANQGVNIYESHTTDRVLAKWAAATGHTRMAQLVAQQDHDHDDTREMYLIFVDEFWPAAVGAGLIDASVSPPAPPIGATEGPYEIPWTETQEYRDQMQAYEERQRALAPPVDQAPAYQPEVVPQINPADYADAIEATNAAALKATPEGGQVSFIQRGGYVLIGNSHPGELRDWVLGDEGGPISGVIVVGKGSTFSPGKLTVSTSGRGGRRAEFEQAIEAISKKKVVWA